MAHVKIIDARTHDRRTVGRYIAKGKITQKEYDTYLQSLPDEEQNGEWVKLDLVDAEITDDDMSDDDDSTDEENNDEAY